MNGEVGLDFIFSILQAFWFVIGISMVLCLFLSTIIVIQEFINQSRMDKLEDDFFDQIERSCNDIS